MAKIWMLESVRVPLTHPDVRARGVTGATEVAARRKAFVLVPETKSRYKNYVAFRQFDPKFATREFRTLTRNGVQMVSAVVKPAVASARLTLTGTRKHGSSARGKPVVATYRGARGIHVVVHVTVKQGATLPKTATLATLAARYAKGHKAGSSLSNIRLVSAKAARMNPAKRARKARPTKRARRVAKPKSWFDRLFG